MNLTSISRIKHNLRNEERLPNGEFSRRRSAKFSPRSVELVLGSVRICKSRDSAGNAFWLEMVALESTSIRSGGALILPVETSFASLSYRFARPLSDFGAKDLNRCGCGGLSQYPCLAASLPSVEESNEVARDLAEKEVFVDVPADEALVIEDVTEGLFSKEPKSVAGSHTKLLSCAS